MLTGIRDNVIVLLACVPLALVVACDGTPDPVTTLPSTAIPTPEIESTVEARQDIATLYAKGLELQQEIATLQDKLESAKQQLATLQTTTESLRVVPPNPPRVEPTPSKHPHNLVAKQLQIHPTVDARVEDDIEITCDQFLGEKHFTLNVQVQLGDSLLVTLCSNSTTGFQWSKSAQISDESILEQIDHRFTPPEEGTPGAAGKEVWSLKALKKGTSTVLLEYNRPWEGGEKRAWSLTVAVVVD